MRKSKPERVQIDGLWYRVSAKTGRPSKSPLTRCSNTMTEAEFRSWVLSGLRDRTMLWRPANDAWQLNTRPNKSGKGRHRIEHQCADCKQWFPKKTKKNRYSIGIELDHIIPIGGLNDFAKAAQWIERAFVEVEGYQKLCTPCHAKKTKEEKRKDE